MPSASDAETGPRPDMPASTPDPPDQPTFVVVGATAVGKSALALALAEATGGEVISLDSRLLYRGMDIGTAKPTAAERARVAHHLVDVAEPALVWSLAQVLDAARAAHADIAGRGLTAVFVGGTGQYVRALLEGWHVPAVAPDPALRTALFAEAEQEGGPEALHRRLAAVDPVSAARLHPGNVRRVVRALEVHAHAGEPLSALQARRLPPLEARVVGLARAGDDLAARIDERVAAMIRAGLEDEATELARLLGWDHPNMTGVGYAEWRARVEAGASVADVAAAIGAATRRLARRQGLWFRRTDPSIEWVHLVDRTSGRGGATDRSVAEDVSAAVDRILRRG